MKLNLLQSLAYPILFWFFDNRSSIGTGRTHLAAQICIDLAMKYGTCYVYDMSSIPLFGPGGTNRQMMFVGRVLSIISQTEDDNRFEYNKVNNELIYKGERKNGQKRADASSD